MASERFKELCDLVAFLRGQRTDREPQWRELARWILPSRGIFDGNATASTPKDRRAHLVNAIATRAVKRAAAGMTAGLVPQSDPWFRFQYRDWQTGERTGRRAFLDEVENAHYTALREARFYPAMFSSHMEYIAFACMLLFQDRGVDTLMRFESCTAGTYAVGLGEAGMIDCCVRDVKFTAQQMAAKFGKANLSNAVKNMLGTEPRRYVDVIHVVRPREVRDATKLDKGNMAYESWFFEAGQADGDVLAEGGYHEMPYHYSAWDTTMGPYGDGPGDDALPDVKQLQTMEMDKLEAIAKGVRPPMLEPAAYKGRLDDRPGGRTKAGAAERDGMKPLYEMRQGIGDVREEIATVMERVDDALLATLFSGLSLDMRPPNMTYGEWLGRQRERLEAAGPSISMHEATVLVPVLLRTYGMLDRAGMLPVPPQDMDEQVLVDIEFVNPLAQAMRRSKADTTRALMAEVGEISKASGNLEVWDKVNIDESVDELGAGIGVPGRIIRSDDEVAAIRQQRADAAAKREQATQNMAALQTMARAGATPTGPDTLAGDLMGKEAPRA